MPEQFKPWTECANLHVAPLTHPSPGIKVADFSWQLGFLFRFQFAHPKKGTGTPFSVPGPPIIRPHWSVMTRKSGAMLPAVMEADG